MSGICTSRIDHGELAVEEGAERRLARLRQHELDLERFEHGPKANRLSGRSSTSSTLGVSLAAPARSSSDPDAERVEQDGDSTGFVT